MVHKYDLRGYIRVYGLSELNRGEAKLPLITIVLTSSGV